MATSKKTKEKKEKTEFKRSAEDEKLYPEMKTESVDCVGEKPHTIIIETDPSGKRVPRITLCDHTEEQTDSESLLVRMNGSMCGCFTFLHNWRNHHKFELLCADNKDVHWEVEYEVVPEA